MTLNCALRQQFRPGIAFIPPWVPSNEYRRTTVNDFLCVHLTVSSEVCISCDVIHRTISVNLDSTNGAIANYWTIAAVLFFLSNLFFLLSCSTGCVAVSTPPVCVQTFFFETLFVQIWTSATESEAHLLKCVQSCLLSSASFWRTLCFVPLAFGGGDNNCIVFTLPYNWHQDQVIGLSGSYDTVWQGKHLL